MNPENLEPREMEEEDLSLLTQAELERTIRGLDQQIEELRAQLNAPQDLEKRDNIQTEIEEITAYKKQIEEQLEGM